MYIYIYSYSTCNQQTKWKCLVTDVIHSPLLYQWLYRGIESTVIVEAAFSCWSVHLSIVFTCIWYASFTSALLVCSSVWVDVFFCFCVNHPLFILHLTFSLHLPHPFPHCPFSLSLFCSFSDASLRLSPLWPGCCWSWGARVCSWASRPRHWSCPGRRCAPCTLTPQCACTRAGNSGWARRRRWR